MEKNALLTRKDVAARGVERAERLDTPGAHVLRHQLPHPEALPPLWGQGWRGDDGQRILNG
jgi:hypothetical protein